MLLHRPVRLSCLALAAMVASADLPADASPVRYFSARRSNAVGAILRDSINRTEYEEGQFRSDGYGPPMLADAGSIVFDFDPDTNELLNFHVGNGDFALEGDGSLDGSAFDKPGRYDFISNPNGSNATVTNISQTGTRFYFRGDGGVTQEVILSFTSALTSTGGRVDFAPFDPNAQFGGETIFTQDTLLDSQVLQEATNIFFENPFPGSETLGQRVISGPTSGNLSNFFLYGIPLETEPGDFNNDGVVDAADYTMLRDAPGLLGVPDPYGVWSANYGNVYPQPAAVPEPASVLLASSLGLLWPLSRSGRRLGERCS